MCTSSAYPASASGPATGYRWSEPRQQPTSAFWPDQLPNQLQVCRLFSKGLHANSWARTAALSSRIKAHAPYPLQVCRWLITEGLHVNSRTRKGATALQLAAHGGHRECVEYLVRSQAMRAACAVCMHGPRRCSWWHLECVECLARSSCHQGRV